MNEPVTPLHPTGPGPPPPTLLSGPSPLDSYAVQVVGYLDGPGPPDAPAMPPQLLALIASVLAELVTRGILTLLRTWWPDLFGARRRRVAGAIDAVLARAYVRVGRPAAERDASYALFARRDELARAFVRWGRDLDRPTLAGIAARCRSMGLDVPADVEDPT